MMILVWGVPILFIRSNLIKRISMKLYLKYHSIGVYVDTWGMRDCKITTNLPLVSCEYEGIIPHVFLGLKTEYELINESFEGQLSGNAKIECALETDLQKHSFPTQIELIEKITQQYENSDKHKNQWVETNNNEILDKEFKFFRQTYRDITTPFKKEIGNKEYQTYKEFKDDFENFAKGKTSNVMDIEGFFGFAPYESALFRTSSFGTKERGGKVFQNNQYNHKRTNNKMANNNSDSEIANTSFSHSFSEGHMLTKIRPLSTFQNKHAYAVNLKSINNNKFYEVAKKILEQVLICDDDFRGDKAFVDGQNAFRFYAVVGRSCVDFVMDKLKILYGDKFDWWDNITWTPQGVYEAIKKHKNDFSKNKDKITMLDLITDTYLFYQNYHTLCKIDSNWNCENGLKTFSQYCNFILHSNLIKDDKLNRLTDNLTHNKVTPLPRNNNTDNIADDINMKLNTHFCIHSYFQDRLKFNKEFQTNISLIAYDKDKKQYFKADANNNFSFSEFYFSQNILSHSVALFYQQPILFTNNPHFLEIKIQENIFNDYSTYFAQSIVGDNKNFCDFRGSIVKDKKIYK